MGPSKIATPREFLDHVASLDVSEFLQNPPDLRAAYHACNSLLSLRDWVCETYKGTPWSFQTATKAPFANSDQLQDALDQIEPRFSTVRDIANASKHMVLRRKTVTTEIYEEGPLGTSVLGATPLGGTLSQILVRIDHQFDDVTQCVASVHDVWRDLFTENLW